jgi:hypothetical protein
MLIYSGASSTTQTRFLGKLFCIFNCGILGQSGQETRTNGRTLLTMDSYDLDEAGRQYFQREGVKYIAAITGQGFANFSQRLVR